MNLTTKMLGDFVNAVNYKPEQSKESHYYRNISGDDVILDGAEVSTPCVPLVTVADGDRVTVTIRENTCYITGVM